MTNEQDNMLKNGPKRAEPKKNIFTKKRVTIALGLLTGGLAAAYVAPKIARRVQTRKLLKAL